MCRRSVVWLKELFAVIEDNVELLIEIEGIGRKRVQMIEESYVRLRSGLMYTLSELSNDGHVYAEKQQLINKASELLEASPETVVMPILMNHYVMLQRNLIYTGITRAKKVIVLVGTKKALAYAVRNVTVTKRNTLLKERLETEK